MRFRRAMAAVLMCLATSLVGVVAAAPDVHADDDLQTHYVHLWPHADRGGWQVAEQAVFYDYTRYFDPNGGPGLNDSVSSIVNDTAYRICFYEHINFGGSVVLMMDPFTELTYVGDTANDRISSHQPC